jgi:arylsulfatase A-like enzyme
MSGGQSALWVDEDMADTLTARAAGFIERNAKQPFFLYFATHDIHVPRVPHSRFAGRSGRGGRGDATLQFDWCVGEILKTLDRLRLADNTLVILSSDNGPVVDDGYRDRSVEMLGDHKPSGPLRGGKYSAFDAGTRVPFIVRWPAGVKAGTSDATVSQIDLCASFAALTGQALAEGDAPDSRDSMQTILGKSRQDREYVVEQSGSSVLSIIKAGWKYIEPRAGAKVSANTNIELGHDPQPQLYNLREDVGEKNNVAAQHPAKVQELAALLKQVRATPRTR